eukprot:Skav209140  [mRNA]  locus=scaffold3458:57251:62031:- [translate_table: standard]
MFPWLRKGADLQERRYPNGATYPAWFEIDEMIKALPENTKISFHLNDTSAFGFLAEADLQLFRPFYRMEAVGFTGGIKAGNVKEWLTRYHQKASEARCWVVCDAQSGFRKKGQRSEEIDLDELRKLIQAAYEWGCEMKPGAPGKEGYSP